MKKYCKYQIIIFCLTCITLIRCNTYLDPQSGDETKVNNENDIIYIDDNNCNEENEDSEISNLNFSSECDLKKYQNELNDNIAKWKKSNILNYQYRYQRECGAWCDIRPEATLRTVQSGECVSSMFEVSLISFKPSGITECTIEDWFDHIQEAIDKKYPISHVNYDSTYGFPTDIYFDMASRDNGGMTIDNLIFDNFKNPRTKQEALDFFTKKWQSESLLNYQFYYFPLPFDMYYMTSSQGPGLKVIIENGNFKAIDSISEENSIQSWEATIKEMMAQGYLETDYFDKEIEYFSIDEYIAQMEDILKKDNDLIMYIRFDPTLGYPTEVHYPDGGGFIIQNVKSLDN